MFVVNGLIGEGGFGKVYTALFNKNNNWYAVKEIRKHGILKHKTGLSMIIGEINALKRVDHPFIASLHFAFQDTNHCYIILDLKTGGDLRYYLKKKLIFEEKDVAFYVSCISAALDHIHSRHIIHRDIKPENIILDERGFPHLTDFGVAHVHQTGTIADDGTLTSYLASGTKQYLAPEVFSKTHVHGPESDYWSLGVVAFELLFGKRPFDKHAPIAFITYLEKCLAPNGKKLVPKMKTSLSSLKSSTSSANGGSSPLTICDAFTRTGSDSRSASFDARGPSSPERQSQQLRQPSSPDRKATAVPGLFPAISRTNSTDCSHSDGHNSYCSSVNFTPVHTLTSGSQTFNSKQCSGGIAERGSFGSFSELGALSADCGDEQHKLGSLANKSFSKTCNGRVSGNALPNLSPKRCKTPPRAMYRIPEGENSVRGPNNAVDGLSLQRMSLEQSLFGDHWAVDDGELPANLMTTIPVSNPWLGNITPNCVNMLEGLFEVRPSHRLGARNITALRNHPWLVEHQVSNWTDLRTKNFTPYFCPGKKFIRETMEAQNDALMRARFHEEDGLDENGEPVEPLSAEMDALFKEFKYTAPAYCEMFPDEAAAMSELQCIDKLTLEEETRNNKKKSTSSHSSRIHSLKQRLGF